HLSDCQCAIENRQRSSSAESGPDCPTHAGSRWKRGVVQQSQHQHERGAREVSHAGEQERAGAPRGDSAQKVACAPTEDSAEAEDLRLGRRVACDRSRGARYGSEPSNGFFAGLALAMAGNTRQAAAVVDELSKRFPGDTVVNNSWGPTIRSEIEVNRGNASKAIELLQLASPYETGLVVRLVPNYARGQAYLKARQSKEAAAEFQQILDHRGVCNTAPD